MIREEERIELTESNKSKSVNLPEFERSAWTEVFTDFCLFQMTKDD